MDKPLEQLAEEKLRDLNLDKVSLRHEGGNLKSQVTILLELSSALKLFHDADSGCYAIIEKSTHREVWPIQSRAFRNWLSHQFFLGTDKGAGGTALQDALATLEARALHQGPLRQVFQRVAWLGDRIVIDLCDDAWRVIEIDSTGWRVLDNSPVVFTRRPGMAPLPNPVPGRLATIMQFINVGAAEAPLVIGWLLMAARGRGPYPVMILNGEQGTGKSTTTRALRSVIDPSTVPLRGLTRDVRDLLVTATNNHVVVCDNLSGLSAELSDVFCRLSTGGGFAERQLYTNREEVLVDLQRPIILNGIDEVASRSDLMERSLIIHLPLIKETTRETESDFWKRFEAALPGILGGLCDALAGALRNQHEVKLARRPRMADFAWWVTAAEEALGWKPGAFMESYATNLDAGVEAALDASPFGEALLKFMTEPHRTTWGGTATDLLEALEKKTHDRARNSQSWPKSGKGAASALRRLAPLFRRMGIVIEHRPRESGTGRRIMAITSSGFRSSQSSQRETLNGGGALPRDVLDLQQSHPHHIVTARARSEAGCDDRDVCDEDMRPSAPSADDIVEVRL